MAKHDRRGGIEAPVPPTGFERLSAEAVVRLLPPTVNELIDLEVLPTVDSTNSYLKQRAAGRARALAVAAEIQTAGRGRYDRQWYSEPGASLCVSLLWPFRSVRADLGALSLAVALAVASIARAEGLPATVKWPNDVLIEDAKLAGILLEAVHDTSMAKVVIGVGLNIAPSERLRAAAGRSVVGLAQADGDHAIKRNRLLSALLSELVTTCQSFEQQGFAAFAERWRSFDALAGRTVVLEQHDRTVQGVAVGVDENGALLLDEHGRIGRYLSGEAWLKVRT